MPLSPLHSQFIGSPRTGGGSLFSARKPRQPQFGAAIHMGPYEDVFSGRDELKYRKDSRDTATAYELLPAPLQAWADELTEAVSPGEIRDYLNSGKLGIVEEYADLLSEYYSFRALEEGIITQTHLNTLALAVIRPAMYDRFPEKTPFSEVFLQVSDTLFPKQVREFQTLTGIEDEALAKEMLTTLCFKFAIFIANGDNRDALRLTHKRLIGEAEELGQKLGSDELAHYLKSYVRDQASGHQAPADMDFRTVPEMLVRRRFRIKDRPFPQDRVIRFAMNKLKNRQFLDYERGNDPAMERRLDYNNRKDVLKRFEAWEEARFLKEQEIPPNRAMATLDTSAGAASLYIGL